MRLPSKPPVQDRLVVFVSIPCAGQLRTCIKICIRSLLSTFLSWKVLLQVIWQGPCPPPTGAAAAPSMLFVLEANLYVRPLAGVAARKISWTPPGCFPPALAGIACGPTLEPVACSTSVST
mmetsp:Transcript_16352/g.35380  ORF Transcript_16352/g.35380 Transcript_16352/m.35380 type:complete len:121 (+) Transcript_16352:3-365(+)